MSENFDVCIMGAGPAGYKAAMILAKNGKKVSLIEKKKSHIGGTCLNEGCIPAKNFLESANFIKKVPVFQKRGALLEFKKFDFESLKAQTDEILDELREGLYKKLQNLGVCIYFDSARFVSPESIVLKNSSKKLFAEKFIVATGSKHKEHPLMKVDKRYIIGSDEVFSLQEIPKKLLIVGAGAIGCEFADFFNSVGCEVHIVEFTPSFLPFEDRDVSSAVQREFKKRGMVCDVSTEVVSYKIENEKVSVELKKNDRFFSGDYDKVLISIGRVPNISEVSLDSAGVEVDDRGFVKVDEHLKTTNSNVYAIGDIIATPALAHVAYHEAKRVSYDILGFDDLKHSVVPNVIFTSPQVGSVGENEKTLKKKGVDYKIKKIFLKGLGMPKIKGDDSGFVKLLLDGKDNLIGASLVGYDMTEIVNQAAICINEKLALDDMDSMIFAHPTMSESFYKCIES